MNAENKVSNELGPSAEGAPDWSEERDRAFHDWLFAQIDRPRLHFHYTGYITIKRFGDLITPYLQECSRVLDAGCGPGEITCYLAQKFPDKTFLGLDHSAVGVEKAEKNRQRLGLKNIRFEARDFLNDPPADPFDLVLFLDAFHHFSDPARTIAQVEGLSDRVLLLEPHGDSQGNWVRHLDFDWINEDLHKVRDHINRILKEEDPGQKIAVDDPVPGRPRATAGEATEHRYPPEFYESLLQGFDLEVHGTISGLDAYGDNVYEKTGSNYFFNRLLVDIFQSIDDRLWKSGYDIFAKHWIIYGEKKGKSQGRTFDGFSRYRTLDRDFVSTAPTEAEKIAGFYDIVYRNCQIPPIVQPGSELWVRVDITNQGYATWSSTDPEHPVKVSYHWLSDHRETVLYDGERGELGKPVAPGKTAFVSLRILAPKEPGRYILQVDAVREGVAWFSQRSQPPLEREVIVRA